jgi:hypothetical protein
MEVTTSYKFMGCVAMEVTNLYTSACNLNFVSV